MSQISVIFLHGFFFLIPLINNCCITLILHFNVIGYIIKLCHRLLLGQHSVQASLTDTPGVYSRSRGLTVQGFPRLQMAHWETRGPVQMGGVPSDLVAVTDRSNTKGYMVGICHGQRLL